VDEIAGEVPVAIYKSDGQVPIRAMQDVVLKSLGSRYVPDEFVRIADLGLDDWPKTLSGKVQKTNLAALVREYREARHSPEADGIGLSLELTVLRIWSSLLGLPPEQIDKKSPLQLFADSISIMRFRDKFKKETGRTLTLEDMVSHNTIGAQIKLLADQRPTPTRTRPVFRPERSGPPSVADMTHTHGDVVHADNTQSLVEEVIEPLGLSWENDVEDVMPAYDLARVLFKRRRHLTWNFRYALMTSAADPRVSIALSTGSQMLTKPV
jgi:aryl carrier-like protein